MSLRRMGFIRMHRTIIKQFGNYRNFGAWCVAGVLTVYFINSIVRPPSSTGKEVVMKMNVEDKKDSIAADGKPVKQLELDSKTIAVPPEHKEAALPVVAPVIPAEAVQKPKAEEPKPVEKKPVAAFVPPTKPGNCGLKEACPVGQYSFFVKSGAGKTDGPTICFNGETIMSPAAGNVKRGINMVIIDGITMKLQTTKIFDVYVSDAELVTFLTSKFKSNELLLAASFDEASFKLTSTGRNTFRSFGIEILTKLDFRDSFAVVGQKGLKVNDAIEQLETKKDGSGYATAAQISGCISNPIAKLREEVIPSSKEKGIQPPQSMDTEDKNCGVPQNCAADAFSVRLYTGYQNKQGIKICVDGKYVMTTDLNDGGRGLNFVVIDPSTRVVAHVSRFDTFAMESSTVEMFIEMLSDNAIVLAVAHDEASDRLDGPVRAIMETVGSSFFHLLGFRDVWAFVGQKGMKGFSPFEQFEYSGADKVKSILTWPKPIDLKTCIPSKIEGVATKRVINRNLQRREFCRKFDGHAEFCDEEHVDLPLVAAAATEKVLKDRTIFKVPIIVIPGLNHHAARLQLEGLFANPAVDTKMITVYFDEKFEEAGALANLFGVTGVSLQSSIKYAYLLEKALADIWKKYKSAKYVIVLEEEVIPKPDFLNFLGQCLPALDADKTLAGASSFNYNGYVKTSGSEDEVYRTEGFPGLGFLLKKSFYDSDMDNKMRQCCATRTWEEWFKDRSVEMIVPATSRVTRGHYDGRASDLLKELFNRPRQSVGSDLIKLSNADELTEAKYEKQLAILLEMAKPFDDPNLLKCLVADDVSYTFPDLPKGVYAVYYDEETVGDDKVLSQLCRCFTLFHINGQKVVRDLHKGLVRFSTQQHTVLLIGSQTVYNKHKPANVQSLKLIH